MRMKLYGLFALILDSIFQAEHVLGRGFGQEKHRKVTEEITQGAVRIGLITAPSRSFSPGIVKTIFMLIQNIVLLINQIGLFDTRETSPTVEEESEEG